MHETPPKNQRPHFAIDPGPGEESVWDYPRPPAVKADRRLIEVRDGATLLARTERSFKVMETASPPTFYIPCEDVNLELLLPISDQTYCEWKGTASYRALKRDPSVPVAWSYETPRSRMDVIKGYLAFYAGRVDCFLGGEQVRAQAGRFYGGWVTSEIIGPFKGEAGTGHW